MFRLFYLLIVYVILYADFFATAQEDSTCTPTRNCKVGCCGSSGWCGFGPAYCGKGNCTSTCQAKAECGPYAPAGQEKCPLNVCCSKNGFCGTTSLFCGNGCVNGCTKVNQPSGKGTSARARTIGYYESWSYARSCDSVAPEDIDPTMWTHINYAFALINPSNFKIAKMNQYDDLLYPKVIDLKLQAPGLKVFIAVGGWDAGGKVFSNMVSTASNRKAFIDSAIQFCKTHGFDGIDIDWEYPAATDRGSSQADLSKFVTFMKELRSAAGKLGVTLTLPSSYWYLKGFDIVNLEPQVDWFNFMSYDIHGTWDGNNPYTQAVVNPHTNITEISIGLDLLWRNNIPSNKVVLGLGFYGRSFTLKDKSCNKPGCAFASGAKPGECTDTSGVLSNAEIQRIIDKKKLKPVFDQKAGVKWVVWDNDQWVSYDDADTFKIKMDWANKLGLGGVMVWALDLDNQDSQSAQYLNSGGDMTNSNGFSRQKAVADSKQAYTGKLAYWTPCMSEKQRRDTGCPPGYHEILVGHGKTFDSEAFEESTGCHGKNNRILCLNNELVGKNCNWNRGSDGSKICDKGCPEGTIFLTQNTHPAGDKTDCAHGSFIAVCCEDLLTLASMCKSQYSADFIFSGGMSGAGNKDFKRKLAGSSKRSPLPSSSAGGNLDHPSTIEHPGIIQVAQVEKRAQDPNLPSEDCDIAFEYHFPKPDSKLGFIAVDADEIVLGGGGGKQTWGVATPSKVTITSTLQPASQTEYYVHNTKTCPFDRYPQLCANWRSVGIFYGQRTVACPTDRVPFNENREAVDQWSRSHTAQWKIWIQKSVWAPYANAYKPAACQVDEWPPYDLYGSRYAGYARYIGVRYLPGGQNGGGSSWMSSRFRFVEDCGPVPIRKTTNTPQEYYQAGYWTDTVWIRTHLTSTRTSIVMDFSGAVSANANDPYRLQENPCWPTMLYPHADLAFALKDDDPLYQYNWLGQNPLAYRYPPAPSVTAGLTPPTRKRNLELLVYPDDSVAYVIDAGNSTRLATPSEIAEGLGIETCSDAECTHEKALLAGKAIGRRERIKQLEKNGEQVDSMMLAGIDIRTISDFSTPTATMVVTSSILFSVATESTLAVGVSGETSPWFVATAVRTLMTAAPLHPN